MSQTATCPYARYISSNIEELDYYYCLKYGGNCDIERYLCSPLFGQRDDFTF